MNNGLYSINKQMENQPLIKNDNKKNAHNLLLCDKLLTSYVLCINKFTIEHSDCNKIHNTLTNLELCNEHKHVNR